MTNKELEAVVLHERYHQLHRHGFMYIIAEAISAAVCVILPVLQDVVHDMKLDFERSADHYALRYQGTPQYVSSALYKLSGIPSTLPFPSFSSSISQRLHHLGTHSQQKPTIKKTKLLMSVLTFMSLSVCAAIPINSTDNVVNASIASECSQTSSCSDTCIKPQEILMSSQTQSNTIKLPASML